MNILHITDIVNPNGNGVAVAVSNYLKYEASNAKIAVYNLNKSFMKDDSIKTFDYSNCQEISQLEEPFNKPDLVVFNEVYKLKFIKLYKECLKNKVPYVIIPHGSLVRDAQNEKKLKKIIGNILLFNRFIRKAAAVQFLNEREKDNSHFLYKKYIISGNGIDVSECGQNIPTNRSLVYIGRYSPYVKGLDLLIDICNKNHEWFVKNKVDVQLYGRTSANGLEVLKQLVEEKHVSEIVKINDAVYGKDKSEVLNNAYGFIQISRHEGQPMGIIEALAYGVPCIVTYGTSFGEFVNENHCGYGCQFECDAIFDSIKLLYENKSQREVMAQNAINCTRNKFDWNNIITSLLIEYQKLIQGN